MSSRLLTSSRRRFAAATMIVLAAAACGSSSSGGSSGGGSSAAPSGPVTLTMWYWGNQEAHGLSTFLATSVSKYEAAAPQHQDQHRAAVDRQPDAQLRRGGEGQEGAGHRVPLGRHLGAPGRVGREPRADLRLHPGGRACALPERVRGHLGRQALERPVVRAAVVPDPVPQGRPRPGRHRLGAHHLEPAPVGLLDAAVEGHHPDRRRRQGRLVRRMALLDPRLGVADLGRRAEAGRRRDEEVHRPRPGRVVDAPRADDQRQVLERRHRLARPVPGPADLGRRQERDDGHGRHRRAQVRHPGRRRARSAS